METINQEFISEIEVKKSRFIAHLVPFSLFERRLKELKAAHPKANHHVTAFRHMNEYRQIVEGSSDDGEPGGTSGPPSLKVLQGHNLVDIAVIIVRYFGGTKLGTGGLARAYAQATGAAITEAETNPWIFVKQISLEVGFSDVSRIERDCQTNGIEILDRTFTENGLKVSLSGEESAVATLQDKWKY